MYPGGGGAANKAAGAGGQDEKAKRTRRPKDGHGNSPWSTLAKGKAATRFPNKSFDQYSGGQRSRLEAATSIGMQAEDGRRSFLPRLAKQKVLDKFIDLSTADVFNRTALWPPKGQHLTNVHAQALKQLG